MVRTDLRRFARRTHMGDFTLPVGEYAVLTVSDTGRGISPTILPRIMLADVVRDATDRVDFRYRLRQRLPGGQPPVGFDRERDRRREPGILRTPGERVDPHPQNQHRDKERLAHEGQRDHKETRAVAGRAKVLPEGRFAAR